MLIYQHSYCEVLSERTSVEGLSISPTYGRLIQLTGGHFPTKECPLLQILSAGDLVHNWL
jgi:hypothetical protein